MGNLGQDMSGQSSARWGAVEPEFSENSAGSCMLKGTSSV